MMNFRQGYTQILWIILDQIPIWDYHRSMKIIAVSTLRLFWEKHPDAEQPLKAWYAEVSKASWATVHELKKDFGSASILKGSRVVFNIKGNRYRVIVAFWFSARRGYIKFVGTHEEYDDIDADTVSL